LVFHCLPCPLYTGFIFSPLSVSAPSTSTPNYPPTPPRPVCGAGSIGQTLPHPALPLAVPGCVIFSSCLFPPRKRSALTHLSFLQFFSTPMAITPDLSPAKINPSSRGCLPSTRTFLFFRQTPSPPVGTLVFGRVLTPRSSLSRTGFFFFETGRAPPSFPIFSPSPPNRYRSRCAPTRRSSSI